MARTSQTKTKATRRLPSSQAASPTPPSSHVKSSGTLPAPAAPTALLGGQLGSPTRIFISYRRQDTAAAAAHLRDSLARRFGQERVFLDLFTIQPGQDFRAMIDQAIAATSVFIALIGPRWLLLKGQNGKRRLDDPDDFVRLEVEAALRHRVTLIPVLVEGARMPTRKELPRSIQDLADRNAYELPWQEGIARLARRLGEIERERVRRDAAQRAELERLDLTRATKTAASAWRSRTAMASFNVVTRAMEMSLERQSHAVLLSPADLADSLALVTGRPMEQGFLFQDLVYVIDFMGVQARKSDERYVARSYPLASFQDLRSQLTLGRPVLVGVTVYGSWFQKPSSKTGVIDVLESDPLQGGVIGAVVAWDPRKEEMKILTPWPGWGDHGIATLSRAAAEKSIDQHQMRSIEVAPMPPGVAERQAARSSPAGEAQDGKPRRRKRGARRAT